MPSPVASTPTVGRVPAAGEVGLRTLDWAGSGRPFLLVDLRRPVVAGQSLGGNVVLRLAESYDDVHALACVDGGWLHLGDRFADWDECWAAPAPPLFTGTAAGAVLEMLRSRHPDWAQAQIEATMVNLRVRADGTVEPRLSREHHASILRSMWEDRPRERYAAIDVPVLLLPAGDPSGPARDLVDQAARLLPRATVRWYAGADHDVHAQYPADVAADLRALA